MKRHLSALLGSAALTFVATLMTSCIPRTVHSREELADHWLGYPIPFIRQNLLRYDPPFPTDFGFDSPWESPSIALHLEPFLASWLLIYLGCIGVAWLLAGCIGRDDAADAR